jgi:hypothetical protein
MVDSRIAPVRGNPYENPLSKGGTLGQVENSLGVRTGLSYASED